ncbi:MAG: hypothetical protein ACJ790_11615 [Myxococcaceae bacterium]
MLFISIIGVVAIVAGYVTLMVLAYRSEDQEFHHPEQNPGDLHHHGSVWMRRSDIKRIGAPEGSQIQLELRRDENGEELVHV